MYTQPYKQVVYPKQCTDTHNNASSFQLKLILTSKHLPNWFYGFDTSKSLYISSLHKNCILLFPSLLDTLCFGLFHCVTFIPGSPGALAASSIEMAVWTNAEKHQAASTIYGRLILGPSNHQIVWIMAPFQDLAPRKFPCDIDAHACQHFSELGPHGLVGQYFSENHTNWGLNICASPLWWGHILPLDTFWFAQQKTAG